MYELAIDRLEWIAVMTCRQNARVYRAAGKEAEAGESEQMEAEFMGAAQALRLASNQAKEGGGL